MTSKKTACPNLLISLAFLGAVSLGASACDDKPQEGEASDVANLADSSGTQAQAQKEADEKSSDIERTSASSPGGATVAKKAPLDASLFLLRTDIPRLERAQSETSPLVGKAPSPSYGTVRIYPSGTDNYGTALQLWKVGDLDAAEEMVVRMRGQYLGVKDAPKNAPVRRKRAFLSTRAGITTYVFAAGDDQASYVAAVSCGEHICTKGWSNVRSIAAQVYERIENPEALDQVAKRRREIAEKDKSRAGEESEEKAEETEKRREIRERRQKEALEKKRRVE